MTVMDEQLLYIINSTTAKEMWDKLLSVHEQRLDASVHTLQQKWYSTMKDPADSMAMHISKLEDLAHILTNMGEQILNSMIMTKILMTLPEKYNFFSAWESTSDNERKLPNLMSRLTIEETQFQSQ